MTRRKLPEALRDFLDTDHSDKNHPDRIPGYGGLHMTFDSTAFSEDDETEDPDSETRSIFEAIAEYCTCAEESFDKTGQEQRAYAKQCKERFVPILVEDIDEYGLSFHALVVDTQDTNLPVYVVGMKTDGEFVKVADSLTSYQSDVLLKR